MEDSRMEQSVVVYGRAQTRNVIRTKIAGRLKLRTIFTLKNRANTVADFFLRQQTGASYRIKTLGTITFAHTFWRHHGFGQRSVN